MTEKIYEIIIPLGVIIIGGIFLPKQVFKFLRELILFVFNSVLKFWYLSLLLLVLSLFVKFNTHFNFENLEIILVQFSAIFFIALFHFIFVFKRKNKNPNIAFYGCYSIKEGEYLSNDIDSEILDERTSKVVESISKNHFIYKNNFIDTDFIHLPNFYTNILGLKKLNSLISKRISKRHLASLHFIRNISEQTVYAQMNFNNGLLANSEHINEETDIINDISSNTKINNNKKIELIVKIFCMIFSQSFNDFLLTNEMYKELHYSTDDNLKLLNSISLDFKGLELSKKYNEFIDFWVSSNYRYKSLLLFEQEEYSGSIDYVFKTLEVNPYYPYRNYVELKQDYTKIYGSQLVPSIIGAKEILDLDTNKDSINNSKSILESPSKYPSIPYNYIILELILRKKQSKEIRELIEKGFDKLDNENPFILLSKSETFKHMKKGKEKYNEIYVKRFDDCISILEKIRLLDSEFTLIRTKLGIMKVLKAMHNNDEKLLEEGMKEWKAGAHFIKELGLE
ncbi:hypothetical protein [Flavobacterium sp. SM2513]|uniref:hypothetical protein n=1 Tax=Flavobacterium sp. SM2513 TaxID=3424766 RepID=UPI003D7FFCBC